MTRPKRFLITTALEESWLDDQPVLFLGEWCRIYSRKSRWSKMNSLTLSDHWEDREKFYADYQYLASFYERLLTALAKKLNSIHGVEHSQRYWRILIGPWIAYFLQMFFDRWLSVQNALRNFEITGTIVMEGSEHQFVPNDMLEMTEWMVGDEWNHYIYSSILKKIEGIRCIPKANTSLRAKNTTARLGFRRAVLACYSSVAKLFVRENDAFMINTYLPFLTEMRLHLRLFQIPQLWISSAPLVVQVASHRRQWKLEENCLTEFEELAVEAIPKNIPRLFLEGYQSLIEQMRGLPWPNRPKALYTANVLWHDTLSMAYMAEKVEQGSPLVYGQHGGLYGMAKFIWAEEHERKIANKYLTWGWSEDGGAATVPIGIPKQVKYRQDKPGQHFATLLLVLGSIPRYTFRLDSEAGTSQMKSSISDCVEFGTCLLGTEAYNALLVRPYVCDYGWCEKDRWALHHPNVTIDDTAKPFWNTANNARLAVCTYNSTGYLELIAGNVPTVVFWDLKGRPIRSSAIPYIDDLRRVGVFHDTPESAANHVKSVWNNVEDWWTDTSVQGVVKRFKEHYCNDSENILERLEAVLKGVASGRGRPVY